MAAPPERKRSPYVSRLVGRCPRCGEGRLFDGFPQQVVHCEHCGEALGRYNVGLLLPFVVVTIVGHVIVFVMLDMELNSRGSPGMYLAVLVPLAVIIPLAIIRPAKGLLIAWLWTRNLSDELQ